MSARHLPSAMPEDVMAGRMVRTVPGRRPGRWRSVSRPAERVARWSSPLPLPSVGTTAGVDPRTVGTWELLRNPGMWVWRIAANGTYEFHSEAGDGAAPQAGTIAAGSGKWSIRALNNGYTDGGTYTFQSPDRLLATGKLGTGAWLRVARGGNE